MNIKTKILLMPFIFTSIITSPVILTTNTEYSNSKITLLEKINNHNKPGKQNYQNKDVNLVNPKIERIFLKNNDNLSALQSVSYEFETQAQKTFSTVTSNSGFSDFWSSLSGVSKGLFITFLTGVGTAVLAGLGYGIYNGIKNNEKNFIQVQEKIPTQKDESVEKEENIQNASSSKTTESYKLTLTITANNEQKNNNWYVWAHGDGFENKTKEIGTHDDSKIHEKHESKMTSEINGNKYTFIFKEVKDASKVTIMLKTGKGVDAKNNLGPFVLSDYLESNDSSKQNKVKYIGKISVEKVS